MKFRTGEYGNMHCANSNYDACYLNIKLVLSSEQYQAIKDIGELDITLEPVQTREERLREARLREFSRVADASERIPSVFSATEAVNIIERVDAEFAKGEK